MEQGLKLQERTRQTMNPLKKHCSQQLPFIEQEKNIWNLLKIL